MCGCSHSSWEPTTQTFHLRGRLLISGLPRPLLSTYACSASVAGRLSITSSGSMPASGLPTALRTLSSPDCSDDMPAPSSAASSAGTSGSVMPRSWMFWRVVMSAQPSSP